MTKEFVIADTHFGHANVIKFERTEFSTITEHDEHIIKMWNSVVRPKDTVYLLGDVALNLNQQEITDRVGQLNGHKILIKGNHDRNTDAFYYRVGFEKVINGPVYIKNGTVILSHFPVMEALNNPYVINIHGHLHNSKLTLSNFICVSAKLLNYTPMNIDDILNKLPPLKSRWECFTKEWYFKYTDFVAGEWHGKSLDEVYTEARKQKHDREVQNDHNIV